MKKIQYMAIRGSIETEFWDEVISRKLEKWKLDDTPKKIKGKLQVSDITGKQILTLDRDSFDIDRAAPPLESDPLITILEGTLYTFNSLDQFKHCDKDSLIEKEAVHIWESICSGSSNIYSDEHSNLISRFLLLCYPDIKERKVYSWLAYPTIVKRYGENEIEDVGDLKVCDCSKLAEVEEVLSLPTGSAKSSPIPIPICSSKSSSKKQYSTVSRTSCSIRLGISYYNYLQLLKLSVGRLSSEGAPKPIHFGMLRHSPLNCRSCGGSSGSDLSGRRIDMKILRDEKSMHNSGKHIESTESEESDDSFCGEHTYELLHMNEYLRKSEIATVDESKEDSIESSSSSIPSAILFILSVTETYDASKNAEEPMNGSMKQQIGQKSRELDESDSFILPWSIRNQLTSLVLSFGNQLQSQQAHYGDGKAQLVTLLVRPTPEEINKMHFQDRKSSTNHFQLGKSLSSVTSSESESVNTSHRPPSEESSVHDKSSALSSESPVYQPTLSNLTLHQEEDMVDRLNSVGPPTPSSIPQGRVFLMSMEPPTDLACIVTIRLSQSNLGFGPSGTPMAAESAVGFGPGSSYTSSSGNVSASKAGLFPAGGLEEVGLPDGLTVVGWELSSRGTPNIRVSTLPRRTPHFPEKLSEHSNSNLDSDWKLNSTPTVNTTTNTNATANDRPKSNSNFEGKVVRKEIGNVPVSLCPSSPETEPSEQPTEIKGETFGSHKKGSESKIEGANMHLRLMRWSQLPHLDICTLNNARVLIIGTGALGCQIGRNLVAWGIRHFIFMDRGRVEDSSPARQSLFSLRDCGKYKAVAAAEAITLCDPAVQATGLCCEVAMPGVPLSLFTHGDSMTDTEYGHHENDPTSMKDARKRLEKAFEDFCQLESAILNSDIVFLATDSRESRWLPSLICSAFGVPAVTAAIGFDTALSLRHGVRPESYAPQRYDSHGRPKYNRTIPTRSSHRERSGINESYSCNSQLSCYHCSGVSVPANSREKMSLDRTCTVSRPAAAAIAAAVAVETAITSLLHPKGFLAGTSYPVDPSPTAGVVKNMDYEGEEEDSFVESTADRLGGVPLQQVRFLLSNFDCLKAITPAFEHCPACSPNVVDSYLAGLPSAQATGELESAKKRRWNFVLKVCNEGPQFLESISGLDTHNKQAATLLGNFSSEESAVLR